MPVWLMPLPEKNCLILIVLPREWQICLCLQREPGVLVCVDCRRRHTAMI